MRRLPLLAALLALALAGCFRAIVPSPPPPTFAAEAETLLRAVEAEGTLVGALVVDARTGGALYAHRDRTRLLPASTMKLAATAAVLSALGPDFRFRTPLWLEGAQRGTLFAGDLVAEASGDPSLGSWRFPETAEACERVAEAVFARGIRRWRGDVRVEGAEVGAGDRLGPGWAWDDAAYAFSAPPTRFVFQENTVDLQLERPADQACAELPVTVRFVPAEGAPEAVVSLDNAAARGGLGCVREPSADRLQCVWRSASPEQCPRQATMRVAVHEPQRLFAECVERALAARGILREPAASKRRAPSAAPAREPLLELASPPLAELVAATNKESLNLYAERLALRFARERTGETGYPALQRAMAQELERRGIAARDLRVADGSGLSRYNLASARGMVGVLQTSLQEPYADALLESLPVAGVDGTLARSAVAEATRGKVRAKTGTLSGQKAYVGLAERTGDPEHPRVVFALMLGNLDESPALSTDEVFARFADALVTLPIR